MLRKQIRMELLKNLDASIARYGIIVINDDNKQFPAIELHIYDMNLNCKYEEVWKESFVLDYNFDFEEKDGEKNIALNVRLKDEENKNVLKIKDDKEDMQLKKEG